MEGARWEIEARGKKGDGGYEMRKARS